MLVDPLIPDGRIDFETAPEHTCTNVPIVAPEQHAAEVREQLLRERYDSASHIVVCEAQAFIGIVRIEDLLAAPASTTVSELADREAPATLAAMGLPWLLGQFNVDPAFGSGPLATVVQDLASILIYFAIAVAVIG